MNSNEDQSLKTDFVGFGTTIQDDTGQEEAGRTGVIAVAEEAPAETITIEHLVPGYILEGKYEIIEKLGEGGLGEAYKAHHAALDIDVVVKRVKNEALNREDLDHALESRLIARFHNDRLPNVYDYIQKPGIAFSVMEFIPGSDLSKVVKSGESYTEDDIVKWGIQICEGVRHLHKMTPVVIHKDIKPENVMRKLNGDIVLIDFNVSSDSQDPEDMIKAISHGYSAPELYPVEENGKLVVKDGQYVFKEVNVRADIYSIGATLYNLLTKEKPPDANRRVRVTRVENTDLFPPGVRGKGGSLTGLQAIIARATLTEAQTRFKSADEMRLALLNIGEFSSAYIKLTWQRRVLALFFALLMLGGSFLTFFGVNGQWTDRVARFNNYISEGEALIVSGSYNEALATASGADGIIADQPEPLLIELSAYNGMGNYQYTNTYTIPGNILNHEKGTAVGLILFEKGVAAFRMGEYPKAEEQFAAAHQKIPDNGIVLREQIRACIHAGYITQAQNLIAQVESGSGLRVKVLESEINISQGNTEEALTVLREIVSMTNIPETEESDYWLAVTSFADITLNGQNLGEGIALLTAVKPFAESRPNYRVELNEYLCQLYDTYAETYESGMPAYEQNINEAINAMLDTRSIGRASDRTLLNLIALYRKLNNLEEAKNIALSAIEIFPANYMFPMYLAFIQVDIEYAKATADERNFDEFYEWAETAVELYGRNPSIVRDQRIDTLVTMEQRIQSGIFIYGNEMEDAQ